MAPASEECDPTVVSEVSVDTVDPPSSAAPAPGAFCCCCGCWQRRKRSRPPRGTDKVGSSDKETLLSGGKTRFYCCESKMTTRPRGGPNRVRNSTNSATNEPPETATAVSPGLCTLFKRREGRDSVNDETGPPPIDIAYDAFDERGYYEEFEIIHREEYDVSRTIVNPTVPHLEVLFHPSQVGRAIIIKGKVSPNARQFTVNLVCREKNDIALHFNPRLDRGFIARNTKLNGHWGVEENSLNGPSPFQSDKEFTLHILVAEEEYKFCHNGRHISSYKHRVPIGRLHMLDIHGDLTLSMVRHQKIEEYPPPVPPVPLEDLILEPHLLSVGHTPLLIPTTHSWRAEIPKQSFFFLGRFDPNIAIGTEIIIGGNVRLLPHAFFINLQDGLQMWKAPEVHLHINPRFENHNHTVVNARLGGSWGFEERYERCRFQPGRPFTLIIRVEKDSFRAIVNGCVLASMDHRARPYEINSLYISGDVDITSVGFNTNLTTSTSTGTGTTKEVTIAEESKWADLNLDDREPYDTGSPRNEREDSIKSPVTEERNEDLTSVEIEKGRKLLNLWEGIKGSRSKRSDLIPQMDEKTSVTVEEPPHANVVIPEASEPVPLPSTSKAGKFTEKNSSTAYTDPLPASPQSELTVATPGQIGRLASHESAHSTSREPAVPVPSQTQDSAPEEADPDVLVGSTRLTESQNLNGEPPQFQTDRNPALTYTTETVTPQERTRADSIVSDDDSIFLSAQHSLEPSLNGSKRSSMEESAKSGVVTSKEKTDNDTKSSGNGS